jgi:hypothetical protein
MNPFQHLRRIIAAVAGLTAALLAFGATPAFAMRYPNPGGPAVPRPAGWNKHPPLPVQVHTVVTGGMPGWQIALIAIAAALFAATVAVLVDRARGARRQPATATT